MPDRVEKRQGKLRKHRILATIGAILVIVVYFLFAWYLMMTPRGF